MGEHGIRYTPPEIFPLNPLVEQGHGADCANGSVATGKQHCINGISAGYICQVGTTAKCANYYNLSKCTSGVSHMYNCESGTTPGATKCCDTGSKPGKCATGGTAGV